MASLVMSMVSVEQSGMGTLDYPSSDHKIPGDRGDEEIYIMVAALPRGGNKISHPDPALLLFPSEDFLARYILPNPQTPAAARRN
jgi:hypothetical protein